MLKLYRLCVEAAKANEQSMRLGHINMAEKKVTIGEKIVGKIENSMRRVFVNDVEVVAEKV